MKMEGKGIIVSKLTRKRIQTRIIILEHTVIMESTE